MVAQNQQVFEYDFEGRPALEGPASSGIPHIEPGPYKASLSSYEEGLSAAGNRTVKISMTVDGNGTSEDGVVLKSTFALMDDPNKQQGWKQLHQFFKAIGLNTQKKVRLTPALIEKQLIGKACIMHVRDRQLPETQRKDQTSGEFMYDDNGNPVMWPARTVSEVSHFESLNGTRPQPQAQAVTQAEEVAAAAEAAPAPAPVAAAPARSPAIAAAAEADESDALFNENA